MVQAHQRAETASADSHAHRLWSLNDDSNGSCLFKPGLDESLMQFYAITQLKKCQEYARNKPR